MVDCQADGSQGGWNKQQKWITAHQIWGIRVEEPDDDGQGVKFCVDEGGALRFEKWDQTEIRQDYSVEKRYLNNGEFSWRTRQWAPSAINYSKRYIKHELKPDVRDWAVKVYELRSNIWD